MKNLVKENLAVIVSTFTLRDENRNGKKAVQKPNLWESGEKSRLYVPTNAWKNADTYIDLNTGEVIGSGEIQHIVEFIKNLENVPVVKPFYMEKTDKAYKLSCEVIFGSRAANATCWLPKSSFTASQCEAIEDKSKMTNEILQQIAAIINNVSILKFNF